MSEAAEFRVDTRAWLEENCPAGARGEGVVPWGSRKVELPKDSRVWLENMAGQGLDGTYLAQVLWWSRP